MHYRTELGRLVSWACPQPKLSTVYSIYEGQLARLHSAVESAAPQLSETNITAPSKGEQYRYMYPLRLQQCPIA